MRKASKKEKLAGRRDRIFKNSEEEGELKKWVLRGMGPEGIPSCERGEPYPAEKKGHLCGRKVSSSWKKQKLERNHPSL